MSPNSLTAEELDLLCPIVYVVVEPSRQPDDGPTSDPFRPRDVRSPDCGSLKARDGGQCSRTQRRRHDRDGGHPEGYAPVPGALGPYLDWIVEMSRGELPPISFFELDPPIDSANATPDSLVRDRAHPVRKARGPSRLRRAARNRHDGVHVIGALVPAAIVRQAGGRDGFADPHRPRAAMAGRTSSGRSRWRFSPVSLRSPSSSGRPCSGGTGHEGRRLRPRCVRLTPVPAARRNRYRRSRELRTRARRRGISGADHRNARERCGGAAVPRVLGVHSCEQCAGRRCRGWSSRPTARATVPRRTGSSWRRSRPPPPWASSWLSSHSASVGRCSRGRTRRDQR